MENRKPWHLVILDMMQERLSHVRHSVQAERDIKELGDIFRKAELPKSGFGKVFIANTIKGFTENVHISSQGDTKNVYDYLLGLYADLIKESS